MSCEHGYALCECKFRAAKDALIKGGQEPFHEEVIQVPVPPALAYHANVVHEDWLVREECKECAQIRYLAFAI